jgi:hypothetical protein
MNYLIEQFVFLTPSEIVPELQYDADTADHLCHYFFHGRLKGQAFLKGPFFGL